MQRRQIFRCHACQVQPPMTLINASLRQCVYWLRDKQHHSWEMPGSAECSCKSQAPTVTLRQSSVPLLANPGSAARREGRPLTVSKQTAASTNILISNFSSIIAAKAGFRIICLRGSWVEAAVSSHDGRRCVVK